MKNDVAELCELIWSDFQDVLLNERMYHAAIHIKIYIYILGTIKKTHYRLVCAKDTVRINQKLKRFLQPGRWEGRGSGQSSPFFFTLT